MKFTITGFSAKGLFHDEWEFFEIGRYYAEFLLKRK